MGKNAKAGKLSRWTIRRWDWGADCGFDCEYLAWRFLCAFSAGALLG